MTSPKMYSEGPELQQRIQGQTKMPDPTFKARMAYARSIRRGSRKHVSAEAFKASVAEAIKVVKPALAVPHPSPEAQVHRDWARHIEGKK